MLFRSGGDCPGEEQPELRGVSFIASLRPAPYQRILIQNRGTGGYTDREYDERRPAAQTFSVALAQDHRGSFLSVVPGPNSFSYRVSNRLQKQTLEQGVAVLDVNVNRIRQNRGFSEIREDRYCSGEKNNRRTSLDACPNGLITLERVGVCPGGRSTTLSMETLGANGPGWNRPNGGWGGSNNGGYGNGGYGGGGYGNGGYGNGSYGNGGYGSGGYGNGGGSGSWAPR